MALLSHRDYDPLLLGSPLRRRGPCVAIGVTLLVLLGFAALVQLGLITGMRPDIESVFLRALLAVEPARPGARSGSSGTSTGASARRRGSSSRRFSGAD